MKIKIFVVLLIIFCGMCGWLWQGYQTALKKPVVIDKSVVIEIQKGDRLDSIIAKLKSLNLPIKKFWFKVIAICSKSHKRIKTGEYELSQGLTIPGILDMFVHGRTKQYAITFPEGWKFSEILQEVEKNPNLDHQLTSMNSTAIASLLMTENKNSAVLSSGLNATSLEGLLFPDTYYFEKHMSDVSLLKRAYHKMETILQQEWQNKATGLPFQTPYEALILASIVEKETGNKTERSQIAGVFVRRLQTGMLLQTDPTVIYGMGELYQGNISYNDLKKPTPYNTYVNKGLPPTPIAMPGRDSINAVMHPNDGNDLYFVSRGDGSHFFSSTLQDHNHAVDIYQRKKSE